LLNSTAIQADSIFVEMIIQAVTRIMKGMQVDNPNARRTIAQTLFYKPEPASEVNFYFSYN